MKVHFKLRWLPALLLAFVLAFTLSSPLKADAAGVNMQNGMPPDGVTVGIDGNPAPTIVSFDGVQWDVIGYDGSGVASAADTMTLLLANVQSNWASYFDTSSNAYNGSTLKSTMDYYAGLVPAKESTLIIPRNLSGGGGNYGETGYDEDLIAGAGVTGAKFWPLSVGEASQLDNAVLTFSSELWRLRSPGTDPGPLYVINAAYVNSDGSIHPEGIAVNTGYHLRPAFNLDLSSVLFSSASVNSGSGAGPYIRTKADAMPGGVLLDVAATNEVPGVPIKFTFLDPSMATPTLALAGTTNGTGSISFGYTGATTGTKQYISCVLEQGGVVKYYGKLADCASASAANGIFILSLTSGNGPAPGAYDLKIFCEQANDINGSTDATSHDFSDFAGAPVGSMTLTVDASGNGTVGGSGFSIDSTTPTLTPGAVSRTSDADATVKFTSSEAGWYMGTLDGEPLSLTLIPMTAAEQTITFDSLTTGSHTLMILAFDAAGNTSNVLNIDIPAYTDDALQALLDMIDSLPDPVKTWADADKVAEATIALNALSDDDQNQLWDEYQDYYYKLYDAQAQAMDVNERDRNVYVSGDLPWNVRIVATPIASSETQYKTFLGKLGGKKLIALYDIKLINLLTGDDFEMPTGMSVIITIKNLPLAGEKNIVIAHEKGTGAEYITAHVKGSTVWFSAYSFSLYGVAADKTSAGGGGTASSSPQTGDSSNTGSLWILLLASAVLIAAAARAMRRRKA